MGIAAYNRGSRVLSERIYGPPRPLPSPQPRPADWGEKTRAKAEARARSILASGRRYGRNDSAEILAGAVRLRVRCTEETAMAAALKAIEESP